MFRYSLLNDDDIERLADGVFEVLEKTGVLCQNRELLEALKSAGAVVDFDAEKAVFPASMCVEFLEQVRCEASAAPSPSCPETGFAPPPLAGFGTQVAQFVYDYASGERRSGGESGLIEMIKLGSVLHPDTPVGHSLLLTDVPPLLEPLEAALLLAEYAPRPAPAFAWNVRQIDYLIEMGEILGTDNWFNWGAVCFAHPLRFDRDVADKFVRRVRSGVSTGLTAMPVAGVSTPISVGGFVIMAAAEIFATWVAARAVNPAVPLSGSIWAGTVDMRTGEVSYCAFDAMRYAFAVWEFLKRWSGKEIAVGGGEYCDAKEPGYFAAYEKAYKAMTIAAFTGHMPAVGQGMLEEGKTLCPVQLLLEREVSLGVQLLGRPAEPWDTSELDEMFEVGLGFEKNYLETESTLTRFRDLLWCPETMDRSGWRGNETDVAVLQKMQAKVEALTACYTKPDVDPDKLAQMRAVVERARKELLG